MPIAPPETAVPDSPPAAPDRRPSRRADAAVALLALALALLVTAGLWLDPDGRAITVNSGDQALFEWLLAYGAHSLQGANPLLTHLLNVPDGVNLAVNTSITVYAWLFAPLTWLVGAPATFAVILTLNLAGTAYAWYWFLSRHLVHSRWAAAVAGLFLGFAPEMVSHANAHLNWTAQWLVPLLLWAVLRLRDWRSGLALGLLVAVSFSIAAEALFFTALAVAVFLLAWGSARRGVAFSRFPSFARGLGWAALFSGLLLSYPLYLHFLGPQTFHGTGFDPRIHAEDIAAYGAYPARSLAGAAGLANRLAPNPTEENSFFGLLLLLIVVCFVALWRGADSARRAVLRALAITALIFAVLSWGPRVKWFGHITDIPLPYAALVHLPVFDAALPSRLALVVTPIFGILLALTLDSVVLPASGRRRWLWVAAYAIALLPLIPVPLFTHEREPIPRFITSGDWRQYVSEGGVLTPATFTSDLMPDGQRWQAYALSHDQGEFRLPAGFFLGPGGPDGRGRIGPVPRFIDNLLTYVAETGGRPMISDVDRARARADLRYWKVEAVVLPDRVHGAKWPVHVEAVREVTTELLGQPERVDDVWLWRIRP